MSFSYGGPILKGIGAIVSTIVFGIFSFHLVKSFNKLEPAQDCYASANSNYGVPADMVPGKSFEDWTNVTVRF